MTNNRSHRLLHETVISNGFCVGCGACSVPEKSPFKMVMDAYGQYQSYLGESRVLDKTEVNYEKLCPFGDGSPNEDEISKHYFSENCEYNTRVGYYNSVFSGHVSEGSFRRNGSSGGMGSWILNELLSKGFVDYVVHVKSETADHDINNIPFKYEVSSSLGEIQKGAKSRYFPIELSDVLKTVRKQPGRYAVVGLPCFIKSIRLLQAQDPVLADRIKYCIGLVCGHLKSRHYAESLAWQMGIAPTDLQSIDFRVKDPSQPANRYSTYAKGESCEKVVPIKQLFGADWGAGAFKYKACDFCDDVFAETADVVVGDAWLPEYVQDSYGTNVVVSRDNEIKNILIDAWSENRLELDELSIDKAAQSQDAGLRHRKDSIAYRLHCEQTDNSWVPKKRTPPVKNLSPRYEMKRQRLRSKMRAMSHDLFLDAKAAGNISLYIDGISPVYYRYTVQGRSVVRRIFSFIKKNLKRLIGVS